MNDPKQLRADPEAFSRSLLSRGGRFQSALDLALRSDARYRDLLRRAEDLRNEKNKASKEIGALMAAGKKSEAEERKKESGLKAAEQSSLEAELVQAEASRRTAFLDLPNVPHQSVPVGQSENDNRVVRSDPEPAAPAFAVKDHAALGEALGIMDFAAGAKLGGSRFAVLKGAGARLHRAVGQFMLDAHTENNGYTEAWVPYLVRPEVLEGTGQLPKFEEDLYKTSPGGAEGTGSLYLIPTSEVPLTNLVRGAVLEAAALPMKLAALTPCFRQEAGSYGKDVRGLIRQHQFDKVELVWVTKPEDSMAALEKLTGHAAGILKELGLAHRVVELCTADLGFASCKTYDLEVWMASERRWREVSSCSNCWDFQARRMETRFKRGPKDAPEHVHTLNGSGLAVGRVFAAVLEAFQRADGAVDVPAPLRSYFGAGVLGA